MKIFNIYKTGLAVLLALCFSFLFILPSCQKENIATPSIKLVIDKPTAKVGETITFKVEGDADFYAIWTGDTKYNYAEYQKEIATSDTSSFKSFSHANVGKSIPTIDKLYTYAYKDAGTFEVVVVATNDGNNGDDTKSMIVKETVTINP